MIGMSRTSGTRIDGLDHIRQSLRDILTTRIGTRLCRRSYGSLFPEQIDQPMNLATRLRILNSIVSAIIRWEPRVRVQHVSLVAEPATLGYRWFAMLTATINDDPTSQTLTIELERLS